MPLKISALNRFGFVQIARTGEPVWTIISIPPTIFGLSTVFWMCCAFIFVVALLCFPWVFFILSWVFFIFPWFFFILLRVFFSFPWVLFGLSWIFFILAWFYLLCREFSLFCSCFLYSFVTFFILPWVFFILTWFSLFCRECSLFWRDFIYVAVTLIILPWFCFSWGDSYGPPYKNSKYVI